MASGIIKRSIKVDGRSTSVSLEDAFYNYLLDIAREDGLTLNQLISKNAKDVTGNLSSALRVYALERAKADSNDRYVAEQDCGLANSLSSQ